MNEPKTCSKLAAGWTSPISTIPGSLMVVPCPECGCIHKTKLTDATREQIREAFVDPILRLGRIKR